jgi:tRNA (guanosine-2'-O-)-methyltransferase
MSDQPRIDPYASSLSDVELRREIGILTRHVTDRRLGRMEEILAQRSRWIATVVEDIYQPHNGSAVLRSCDAFGVQDVHIIENRNRYQVNPGVELGTAQWLSMYRYTSGVPAGGGSAATQPGAASASRVPAAGATEAQTRAAVATLHRLGYRVAAMTPHRDDTLLQDLDLAAGPVALMFGSEKEGLSATALELADEYVRIPMRGFVESLNISVSAAVSMEHLGRTLRSSSLPWELPERDRLIILARWLRRSVRHAGLILERERADPL